jgi:hypothetical protein
LSISGWLTEKMPTFGHKVVYRRAHDFMDKRKYIEDGLQGELASITLHRAYADAHHVDSGMVEERESGYKKKVEAHDESPEGTYLESCIPALKDTVEVITD